MASLASAALVLTTNQMQKESDEDRAELKKSHSTLLFIKKLGSIRERQDRKSKRGRGRIRRMYVKQSRGKARRRVTTKYRASSPHASIINFWFS